VLEIRETDTFSKWLRRWRPSWRGSVHYGPEYRVYFVQRGPYTVVLLCDGDKSSQDTDIDRAMRLAKEED